jgi:ubiquinone/menaquinone biosynthesis C-methylase UbiE
MPSSHSQHRHQHGVMTGWIVRPYDLVVGGWLMRGSYRRIAAGFTAGIASHQRVLDIGTGPGRLVEAIAHRRPDLTVIGVDPSLDMIARASRRTTRLANVETITAAAEDLPVEDDSVAAVVSTLSSHHWADAEAALAEQVRVLAPGGRFWLVDLISHLPGTVETQVEAAGLWPTDDSPGLTGITGRRLRVITARKPLAAA